MVTDERNDEDILRQRAVGQVKKRRDFYGHLLVFALVNGAAIAIWATVGDGGVLLAHLLALRLGDRPDHERLGRLLPEL
jgi:hypothetical protein